MPAGEKERNFAMKKYIGTKLIEAEPAYRVDGKVVALAENKVPRGYKVERGYKVRYADGYESFSPNEVFERAYLPLEVNGKLKTEAPSISAEMVERFIDHHETVAMGGKTTVVRAVLKNGFEIVESSSCVSAENYDEKLGEEICMKRIRNKVWELLGFLLQTAVGGVNGEAINKANEIANLKADNDILREKARYAEAALGRANAEVSRVTVGCRHVEEERDYMHQKWSNAEQRANYAEGHPWKNLWAWVKRKLKMA